ncbi:MAG: hypothetical protein JF609_05270 [Verrucomicrobia bacterium]|nr:hypothetical protein [Verrucomicrobiota bacterium]
MTVSWKTWLWRTIVTTAIVTLIAACFYAEENSRGVSVWKKCEREITARGESLNWDDFIPAPVPDDQNFHKAPMVTEWFVRGSTNSYKTAFTTRLFNPDNTANIITDISASNYVAWSDTFETEFSQINNALKRPAAQIDGDYSHPFRGPIQNFVAYRIVSQVLVHRAKCHLLLGEPDKALDDLTLLHGLNLTLTESGRTDLLVTSMIHTAITGIYEMRSPMALIHVPGASRNWPSSKSNWLKSTYYLSLATPFELSVPVHVGFSILHRLMNSWLTPG